MESAEQYDELIERVVWFFITNNRELLDSEEAIASIQDILYEVEDPLTFTLHLFKWVQGLILYGASHSGSTDMAVLEEFKDMLANAQRRGRRDGIA